MRRHGHGRPRISAAFGAASSNRLRARSAVLPAIAPPRSARSFAESRPCFSARSSRIWLALSYVVWPTSMQSPLGASHDDLEQCAPVGIFVNELQSSACSIAVAVRRVPNRAAISRKSSGRKRRSWIAARRRRTASSGSRPAVFAFSRRSTTNHSGLGLRGNGTRRSRNRFPPRSKVPVLLVL